LFLYALLFSSCKTDREVRKEYKYLADGSPYQEVIYFESGNRTEIFFQQDLFNGTFQNYDNFGKVKDRGKYVGGKFISDDTEGDIRVQFFVSFFSVFFGIWVIFKSIKNHQKIQDWYRNRKKIINY